MDNQEAYKDGIVGDIKDNNIVLSNTSQRDHIYKALLLKTERLASAIYLITGLMDTGDILRLKLRSASVDSVNDLYSIGQSSGDSGAHVPDKILKRISYISSLLEIGLAGELISQMNYSILKNEYSKLGDVLVRSQVIKGVGSFILQSSFFGNDLSDLTNMTPDCIKDINKTAGQMSVRKGTDKMSRQDLIVKIIKDGSEYTIKDILSEVSAIAVGGIDCSEKTIQRDLLSLVAGGILKKKGEKRWSRYMRNGTIVAV